MGSSEASGTGASCWRLARTTSSTASTPIEAGPKGTLVQDPVAVSPSIACRTDAGVVVDSILAGASVKAGVSITLVDVGFAALAGKPCAAAAHTVATVELTQTSISAGKRRALVHFLLAVEPGVASGTLAHVAAPVVLLLTFPLVEAGRVSTGQQAVLTVGTLEALGTGAHVAALQICACPPIPAGVAVTLLHLQLTVDPREAWQACTRIASLASVHASGAIHAGMVMGAEVQVLVT